MRPNLSIQFSPFWIVLLVSCLWALYPRTWSLFLTFFFLEVSLICFLFVFLPWCDPLWINFFSKFIFAYECLIVWAPFCCKDCFLCRTDFGSSSKITWVYLYGSISGSSFLFFLCVYPIPWCFDCCIAV